MDKEMKIQIDGTNTVNKGAELMLYAILQEIEKKYPEAKVIYNRLGEKISYIQTPLNFKTRPFSTEISMLAKLKIRGLLRRLSIPCSFLSTKYPLSGIDIILDAGGFQFSDQWNRSDYELSLGENYYRNLKKNGTKIIFLPQAFGPFQTENGKKSAVMVSKYADIIFARETVSYKYLVEAGVDKNKIKIYPDFTAPIEGIIPKQYEFLKNGVCIIPNIRMIDKGVIPMENYLSFIIQIIKKVKEMNKIPFLLNHEGRKDAYLCKIINEQFENSLTIADKLTALEVKGIISQSYLLISSRFHGVASALNSGVPCLATSWSHKYEELFKDYNQFNCVLDIKNIEKSLEQIEEYLSEQVHEEIACNLKNNTKSFIEGKNKEMWNVVWDISMKK
jgi:colanic acid/amylovoran biosynthesis protein